AAPQRLAPGSEPIDARRQHRLGGGRNPDPLLEVGGPRGQAARSTLASQDRRLDQVPDAFLEGEGGPVGPRDQQALERLEGPIAPEQRVQQLLVAFRRQRVDAELTVVALPAPEMPVLGAVIDEQKQTRGWHTLDEAVQERMSLTTDPLKVLEENEQGLDVALANQQALDRIKGLLSALGWIESIPRGIGGGGREGRETPP